jgi:hypothetical protein
VTIPYPDDEYLLLIGRFAYAVTYLEGAVLGDLSRHAAVLPLELTVDALAGKSTGLIAGTIRDHVRKVPDSAVAAWLAAGAEHLAAAATLRNPVLHARPATIDGQQRLRHWKLGARRQAAEAYPITTEVLAAGIAEIERRRAELERLRP